MPKAEDKPYRIWFQGATHPSVHGEYTERLEAHLRAVKDPEFDFQFHGCNPPATTTHALTEFRIGGQMVRNTVQAEREGFDAVAIGHFQDAGLHEAKSAVDIPVLGLGETTLLHACSLGRKLGLVTINPAFIPWHEDQVSRYGLERRVVGVRAVEAKIGDFMDAFASKAGYDALYPKFEREAKALTDAGADVIVPAGGLPMLLFGNPPGAAIDGAPVVNGLLVLAKTAEMAIRLRALGEPWISRRSNYARPPEQALENFLGGH